MFSIYLHTKFYVPSVFRTAAMLVYCLQRKIP